MCKLQRINHYANTGIAHWARYEIEENVFTKFNAESAKAALEKFNSNSNDLVVKFAIENNRRIIRGYTLRSKALESGKKEDIESFCDFYVTEAFYHD